MSNSNQWKPAVYALDEAENATRIVDTANNLNFCFIAESGFGLRSTSRALALRIVAFMNSLPESERNVY